MERLLRQSLAGVAGTAAQAVVILILTVAAIVLGAMVFASLAAVLFGVYTLLGQPAMLASPVALGWFFGSLVILFLLLRRAHRWLTLAINADQVVERVIDPELDDIVVPEPPSPLQDDFGARLAAVDARHASPGPPRGEETPAPDEAANR